MTQKCYIQPKMTIVRRQLAENAVVRFTEITTKPGVIHTSTFMPPWFDRDDLESAWMLNPAEVFGRAEAADPDANARTAQQISANFGEIFDLETKKRLADATAKRLSVTNASIVLTVVYAQPDGAGHDVMFLESARVVTQKGFGPKTLVMAMPMGCVGYWARAQQFNRIVEYVLNDELAGRFLVDPENLRLNFDRWKWRKGYSALLPSYDPKVDTIFQRSEGNCRSDSDDDDDDDIPKTAREELESALWRYMSFCGIVDSSCVSERQILEDQRRFAHLYEETPEGLAIVNNKDEFMHELTGLRREWCARYRI